jgi:hypothetical protein
MEKIIYWKKQPFTRTYNIVSDGNIAGQLEINMFGHKANGVYGDLKLTFAVKGWFNRIIYILNQGTGELMGSARLNFWRRKGYINLVDHSEYFMKYLNIWRNKWIINNYNGAQQISFTKKFLKGYICSETENGLLILTGLFINQYLTAKKNNYY